MSLMMSSRECKINQSNLLYLYCTELLSHTSADLNQQLSLPVRVDYPWVHQIHLPVINTDYFNSHVLSQVKMFDLPDLTTSSSTNDLPVLLVHGEPALVHHRQVPSHCSLKMRREHHVIAALSFILTRCDVWTSLHSVVGWIRKWFMHWHGWS